MSEPRIIDDGPGSEWHALTGRVRTVYRCYLCPFQSGAEWRHVPASGLPPELRDEAAWRQEAAAQAAEREGRRYKTEARRAFDAHRCDSERAAR